MPGELLLQTTLNMTRKSGFLEGQYVEWLKTYAQYTVTEENSNQETFLQMHTSYIQVYSGLVPGSFKCCGIGRGQEPVKNESEGNLNKKSIRNEYRTEN